MTSAAASRPTGHRLAVVAYALLFLSVVGLDQTTKWHSEKAFLAHSDPRDSEIYQARHSLVFGLGTSPGEVEIAARNAEAGAAPGGTPEPIPTPSRNWLEFNVTYLRNHGAVWGIFSDLAPTLRLGLFYSVTVVAVFGVLYLFRKTPPSNRVYRSALIFILAGAVGNFIDRLLLTYVIDWIHFQWHLLGWEYSFPVFNVADISIDVGIGLMLLDMILVEWRARKGIEAPAGTPSPAT